MNLLVDLKSSSNNILLPRSVSMRSRNSFLYNMNDHYKLNDRKIIINSKIYESSYNNEVSTWAFALIY